MDYRNCGTAKRNNNYPWLRRFDLWTGHRAGDPSRYRSHLRRGYRRSSPAETAPPSRLHGIDREWSRGGMGGGGGSRWGRRRDNNLDAESRFKFRSSVSYTRSCRKILISFRHPPTPPAAIGFVSSPDVGCYRIARKKWNRQAFFGKMMFWRVSFDPSSVGKENCYFVFLRA